MLIVTQPVNVTGLCGLKLTKIIYFPYFFDLFDITYYQLNNIYNSNKVKLISSVYVRKKKTAVRKTSNNLSSKNIIVRFYKYYFIDSILIVKDEGFKALFKKRGWKVLAIIVAYYAVRDTILYIIIPFLIAQKIF